MTNETAARDPRENPQPGDRLHHPEFAGGATFTVTAVAGPDPKNLARFRSGRVSCRIEADDGHKLEQRGRSYDRASWFHMMRRATVLLALLACLVCAPAFADSIDTALVDNPDGTATALYGCASYEFDTGEIVLECAGSLPAYAYTPMSSTAPLIVFGALADQFEYWPSTGACVLLRREPAPPFGQTTWEVSCGDVIARSGFDG